MRPPRESPNTRMNRIDEMTGASTVWVQSFETRSVSRLQSQTRPVIRPWPSRRRPEAAREQQPAALAARELRGARVALRLETEGGDQLVRARPGILHPEVAAVVHERLAHGQEAVEVDVLLGEPDRVARGHRVVGL